MPKRIVTMILLLLSAMFAGTCAYAASDPSMHQVYEAAQSGHMREAQAMMDQVLRDHPNSAKAHYVEAQLLAKQGQLSAASGELASAERLEPGLPFAKASAVHELEQRLASRNGVRYAPAGFNHGGMSPGMSLGLILLGIALITALVYFVRAMSQRNMAVAPAGSNAYGTSNVVTPYGAGGFSAPAGGVGGVGGGLGSRIAGGLATGAALGAGMVAGEALMRHFTGGGSAAAGGSMLNPTSSDWDAPAVNDDMGGSDFGVSDNSSWDDGSSWDGGGGGMGDDWN